MVIVGVVASGCDWTLFGYDGANTRNSPDTGISMSNVESLAKSWTYAFAAGNTGQIVDSVTEADDVVYVTSDIDLPGYSYGTLAAFSATDCPETPTSCTPLWVAPTGSVFGNYGMQGTPIVANGEVYVSNRAWQAAFSTDDSGCTARVMGIPLCTPLRVYDDGSSANSSPLVVNNLLYAPGTGKVFSADGSQGCAYKTGDTWAGAPILVCEPLWTNVASAGSSLTYGGTPTVATATAGPYKGHSILYLAAPTSGGFIRVFAYDANGVNNCGAIYGVPVCAPLWTDQASGEFSTQLGAGAVSVANGYAYVGGSNSVGQGTLFAFDQNGVIGCSSGTCQPEFQTSAGPGVPTPINLAVSGSTVIGTGNGDLFAFNGAGCGGPASCTGTLWSAGEICADGVATSSVIGDIGGANVSNGLVYVGITCGSGGGGLGAAGGVAAYNISGTRLWSAASPDGGTVYNAPIVANGVLYFGTVNGSIYAYAPS